MKQSQLFTKTKKLIPKDELSKNAQLLIRAGYIYKEMAGVYSFLPLGLRVVEKIEKIIKKEMDLIGGVQMKNSALQKKSIWQKTNRWSDDVVDSWFKTELKNGTELGLAFSHEEALTNLVKNYISSYKDLPVYLYDIRTIFRNEARAKSGLIRGREFYWKALYSFSKDKTQHNLFYDQVKQAYQKIYKQVSLDKITYLTFASGGTFSKYSHEFQTVSKAGEDIIYIDEKKNIAVNKEIYSDKVLQELDLKKENLIEKKAVEVGNIFSLGSKFSKPIGLVYKNKDGKETPVFMGCYGIGISRLMGTIAEIYNDEKGIIWPESVAPFQVHLISLRKNKEAEKIYTELLKNNIEVLYDDRDMSVGEKFADADLIGLPYRVVISEKSLSNDGAEIKKRNEKKSRIIALDKLANELK